MRAVREIAETMSQGRSAVVVFPDWLVRDGIADAVLDVLRDAGSHVEFCDGGAEAPFPSRILATFGGDPVRDRAYDNWEMIISWEPWHGSCVILVGWEYGDIVSVLERWPPQLHASPLSAELRPKLIIAVRASDIERSVLTRLDRENVDVLWWWGVLDRLDTETRLAAIADRRLNIVDAAVVTEVAGWDLDCVDHLVEHWDRTTAGLPGAVRRYRENSPRDSAPEMSERLRAVEAPPAEYENWWRDGLIDRWGHSARVSPVLLGEKEVAQRQWIAHNRTFMPFIDEERDHFERKVVAAARPSVLEEVHRRDTDIIEIGPLAWLVNTGRVVIGRPEEKRLSAFRDLRNDLAHRIPVNDALRRRIIGYLDL